MQSFPDFEARISEEACLGEIMRLRQGDKPCQACGKRAGYEHAPRHRALTCKGCGFKVFPCVGTPFARPQPNLRQWFYAIHRAAGEKVTARTLKGALDLPPKQADQLAADVAALKSDDGASAGDLDWFHLVEAFVEKRHDGPLLAAAKPTTAVSQLNKSGSPSKAAGNGAAPPSPKRRTGILARGLDRWTYVGIGGIFGLALMAAGIGWLMVPDAPEEDQELVQATAILTLANDKPVILVTADVAEQLYDVSDDEHDAGAPPIPSIRLAPVPGAAGAGGVEGSKPLSQPSIKLSSSAGQSLLSGDLAAVKSKGSRPELAAYSQLAAELEAKGPRNPDELLSFGPMKIRRYLVEKVYKAAITAQMDPILLMAIADKESSFVTEIQAKTSSATGLFQFIEKTWLGVVRDFGPAYGLDKDAGLVASGSMPAGDRTRILDLRRDAYLSALFAAEMLKRDRDRISRHIGRPLTGGEIYLVHFLGPDGAEKLLVQAAAAPTAAASDLLPKPAEANKTIFYGTATDGAAKKLSVTEVKEKLETMISVRTERYRNLRGVTVGTTAAK